eukprot:11200855-Lingulodinium_polyedra.AAC.1
MVCAPWPGGVFRPVADDLLPRVWWASLLAWCIYTYCGVGRALATVAGASAPGHCCPRHALQWN